MTGVCLLPRFVLRGVLLPVLVVGAVVAAAAYAVSDKEAKKAKA